MLHLPSYELGKQVACFDLAADAVKEEPRLLAGLLTFPDTYPGLAPIGLVPSSFKEGYEFEAARHDRDDHDASHCEVCEFRSIVQQSHSTERATERIVASIGGKSR